LQAGEQLQVVSSLLKALATSESPDDLCRLLGEEVLGAFDVAATYLAVLAPDGRITMVGSWGYPADRRDPADRPSLWYPMAITDTVRSGEIQVFENWQAYMDRYPHLGHRAAPGKSFVCVPFNTGGVGTGGLGLTFNTELVGHPQHQDLWEILAQAGDIFVNRSWAESLFRASSIPVVQRDAEASPEAIRASFSERDLKVIRLTVDGKTVQHISRELRYSESTIKQTRIAVYRKLGVKRAVDLAHAAAALGIL
jgi:DNA-binding CsgD family transcriptional regulator